MKYKFKPQTCLLVAGAIAATYAQACYYHQTTGICWFSGDTVDYITWSSGVKQVIATGTFTGTADTVVTVNNGSQGYTSYNAGNAPSFCSGPAKFQDPSGHWNTVPYWENGIANCGGGPSVPFAPKNDAGAKWGTTTGQTCSG